MGQLKNQEVELVEARRELQLLKQENVRLASDTQRRQQSSVASGPGSSSAVAQASEQDSPPPPNPEWEYCQEFFNDLTYNVKEMYRYEATIHKLDLRLWPGLRNKNDWNLSGPLLKVKSQAKW